MLNNNYLNSGSDNNEVMRLKRIITILLSLSAILAVVLVTMGVTKVINYARTSETSEYVPVLATLVSTEVTYTEPTVYHTEQLEATPLADSYWRELPELLEDEVKVPDHFEVKGLYIGSGSALDKAIELCNNSELNTIVIDLKNEYGLPYMSKVPTAKEIGYVWDAYDLDAVIEKCHNNNIRVIGRIVSFNDQVAAQHFPERAIQDVDGNVVQFSNEGNKPFLNPYNTDNWDYLIAIGIEAAEHGVDEIQFDYVRFPAGATKNKVKPYFGEDGQYPEKSEAVNRFLQEARIRIQDTYGVPVSADIFGIVLTSEGDAKIIGQNFSTLGMTGIDSCCPMVYPSHYALGTMLGGHVFDYPDKQPYLMVYSVLHECQAIYKQPGFTTVRPYLQAFTASYIGKGNYIEYGYREINSQIKAIHDLGITEFILWDPSCKYPSGSYDGNMSVETD
jgi:hypothetical protein